MKKYIGFVILLIAFVCFTGCTQTAVPEAVTTPATTVPTNSNRGINSCNKNTTNFSSDHHGSCFNKNYFSNCEGCHYYLYAE